MCHQASSPSIHSPLAHPTQSPLCTYSNQLLVYSSLLTPRSIVCSACLLSLASAIALRHLVHRVLVSTVLALGWTEKLSLHIAQFFLLHIIYTTLHSTLRSMSMTVTLPWSDTLTMTPSSASVQQCSAWKSDNEEAI